MDGKQGGDPAKLADALVQLAALEEPPVRFAAGADAVDTFQQKARALLAQAAAHRELSISLAHRRLNRRRSEDDLGAAQRTLRVHRRQVAGAGGALLEVQVAAVRRGQLPGPGDDLPGRTRCPGRTSSRRAWPMT